MRLRLLDVLHVAYVGCECVMCGWGLVRLRLSKKGWLAGDIVYNWRDRGLPGSVLTWQPGLCCRGL